MRTVKHKIKPFNISENSEQEIQFLALARAYQFEKNYWSDQLLNLLNRSHESINIDFSYNQIRDNLVKNKYQSKYNLPARIWKMALKEAYDLHIRTYESQISFIKRDINNKIYKFKPASPSLLPKLELDKDESSESSDSRSANSALHIFKEFLYFAINSLFYNYKTFRKFEEEFYSKNFRKARIYQRIQPILQKLLKKAIEKEVFKLNHADEINIYKENIEILKQFLHDKSKTRDLVNKEKRELQLYLEELLNHYCNCLVKAIVQFRNCKPIQSQINPTITLDGDCYDLYSNYDNEAKKNRWFLNIMSLENGRRIKGLELTGFNHAKKIMKHKKSPNLTLSFDRTDMTYYAHFTFKQKVKSSRTIVKTKKSISFTEGEANKTLQQNNNNITANMLMTMLTVGGDFGLTENYTFSDGWVSGREQGQILKNIADKTKNSVAGLQRISENGFFGLEKNNPIGKRNHKNNCFNHNKLLDNINKNYRKKQRKYNRFLQNYKYVLVNEIIEHFTSDSIYGQYTQATHESHAPVKLVFESLDYVSLGRNKSQKRQINLIKGILNVLEDKIKAKSYNLPIEIIYVNPAYTSQTCPNCCFVAKTNRDSKAGKFRCQHCGFTAIDDERYQGLTKSKTILREHLPSEDERSFVAACNIAARHSAIPDSMKLRVRDIKYRLMQKHESIKVSCKIFNSS
jgi:predicted RNA-binding Zn-ribbon protein involved in translation (DUF1610 family)